MFTEPHPGGRSSAARQSADADAGAAAAPAPDEPPADEHFDLASFRPPAAPRSARRLDGTALRFTLLDAGSFCRIALHRSVPAQGSLAADFRAEWLRRVAGAEPGTSAAPDCRTMPLAHGWTLAAGAAPVALGAARAGAALLFTWGGHGRRLSVVAVFDDGRWQPAVDDFVASIRLRAPPSAALAGTRWQRRAAGDGDLTQWQLALARGGRYALGRECRVEGAAAPAGGWTERLEERGRWRQAGDTLVLEPAKTEVLAYERVPGRAPALRVHALAPEATAYRLQSRFDPATAAWQLQLSPLGGRPTRRDGPFSDEPAAPQSYLFAPEG